MNNNNNNNNNIINFICPVAESYVAGSTLEAGAAAELAASRK